MFTINSSRRTEKRFDMSKFLEWSQLVQMYDPLTSLFDSLLHGLSPEGTYTVDVPDARPDWLSFKIYGDTQYAWILLWCNDIGSFRDLKKGAVISYPSLSDLDTIYLTLGSVGTVMVLH